jgi:translation initiation factor 1A
MSKRNFKKDNDSKVSRSLIYKDNDTEYGVVTKKLGNGRFTIKINVLNREVTGRLCGKFRKGAMKKNNWVDIDSVVLVGIRNFQNDIVDIVYVYESSEVRQLKKEDKLLDFNLNDKDNQDDDVFDFAEI